MKVEVAPIARCRCNSRTHTDAEIADNEADIARRIMFDLVTTRTGPSGIAMSRVA